MRQSSDSNTSLPERILLERLTSGDHAAFKMLAQLYLPELLRYAYRIVQSRDVSEDVVQDVLCWLWNNHQTIAVRGSLRDYLFGAVRHRALNYLRDAHALTERESRYAREDAADGMASPLENPGLNLEQQELTTAVQHAIDQLPARRRQIVLLRWRQLTYAEIAEVMGISVKTVEAQVTSAYNTLRTMLSSWVK